MGKATDWKDNPVEPHCSRTEITIMEAGTRILCPIGYYKGWTFKKAGVLPGTSITATKTFFQQVLLKTAK